jgi:hypothetical protein
MSEPLIQVHPTFSTTHWSKVVAVSQGDSIDGLVVLNRLILRYQGALKAHLIRKYRLSNPDAADVAKFHGGKNPYIKPSEFCGCRPWSIPDLLADRVGSVLSQHGAPDSSQTLLPRRRLCVFVGSESKEAYGA